MIRTKSLIALFGLVSFLILHPLTGAMAADLDMPNATYPMENVIVGGQPSRADFEELRASGVTTIINLRTAGEFDDFDEKAVVEALGMTYINIPVYGMRDIDDDTATAINAALDNAEGDVLIHCTVGMRAGLALAYAEYRAGHVTADEAIELAGAAHMEHLESYMERLIEDNGG